MPNIRPYQPTPLSYMLTTFMYPTCHEQGTTVSALSFITNLQLSNCINLTRGFRGVPAANLSADRPKLCEISLQAWANAGVKKVFVDF